MEGIYFEKTTFGSFLRDVKKSDLLIESIYRHKEDNVDIVQYIKSCYDNITLPKRKTQYSAGYDFSCPFNIDLRPGEIIKIPTGIKAHMPENLFLSINIRSSLGIKRQLRICNSVGIIDCDYYDNPSNEGDIIIALKDERSNDTPSYIFNKIKANECIVQGIFLPYYITENDNSTEIRVGGIGSTSE